MNNLQIKGTTKNTDKAVILSHLPSVRTPSQKRGLSFSYSP